MSIARARRLECVRRVAAGLEGHPALSRAPPGTAEALRSDAHTRASITCQIAHYLLVEFGLPLLTVLLKLIAG